MIKNTAGQKWIVFAFDTATGLPKTGDRLNITANLRLDGGAANPIDDTNPAELEGGYYAFDLTEAETNGDLIVICPSSVTENIQVIGVPGAVWTEPTGGVATALNLATVDTVVDAIKLKTDTLGGAGAITWTYTLTDSVTSAPIDGAEVWITTDVEGTNVIASGVTNTLGVVVFTLDAATLYFWRKKAGYNFSNPVETEVS